MGGGGQKAADQTAGRAFWTEPSPNTHEEPQFAAEIIMTLPDYKELPF